MARILIAEDEEPLRALTARALTDSGHKVVTAVDGADALEILTREQGRFDLLLTDIRMPLMDGIALALATARDHPRIIILLMTAYADPRRADPRRDPETVHACRNQGGGERGAGGEQGGALKTHKAVCLRRSVQTQLEDMALVGL